MSLDYVDPSTPPPVEWTGAIFPEPMLYRLAPLWLFLLVIAVAGLLLYRHRLMDERAARHRAPEELFRSIRKALDQALCKPGDEIIGPARKVVDLMEARLGPLLTFGVPLNGSLGRLKKALEGKGKVKVDHPVADHSGGATVVIASGHNPNVVIGSGHTVSGEEKAPPPPVHEKEGEMTARDRRIAVREALEDISAFWSKDRVERDLRSIRDALTGKSSMGTASPRLASPAFRRSAASAPVLPTAKPAPKPH